MSGLVKSNTFYFTLVLLQLNMVKEKHNLCNWHQLNWSLLTLGEPWVLSVSLTVFPYCSSFLILGNQRTSSYVKISNPTSKLNAACLLHILSWQLDFLLLRENKQSRKWSHQHFNQIRTTYLIIIVNVKFLGVSEFIKLTWKYAFVKRTNSKIV